MAFDWPRLARHGYLAGVVAIGLAYALALVPGGADVHAYWAMNRTMPYGLVVGEFDAFLYSPVAALANVPLTSLPWPIYASGAVVLSMLALYRLAGAWSVLLLMWPAVSLELLMGNIHLLLAIAVVVAYRHPAIWAVLLLTKVTTGVGVLWFAFRGEWRSFGVAAAVTGGLVAASMLISPGWWPAWFETLRASATAPVNLTVDIPLAYRLPLAVLAVWWGARHDNPALLAVAVMLALPRLGGSYPVLLLAAVPLWMSGAGRDLRRSADPNAARPLKSCTASDTPSTTQPRMAA